MKTKFKPLVLLLLVVLTLLSACSSSDLVEGTSKEDQQKAEQQKAEKVKEIKFILTDIMNSHVEKLENGVTGANTIIYLIDSLDKLKSVTTALEDLSSGINKHIISLESMTFSEEESRPYNGLIDAMKAYKSAVDAKISFLNSNGAKITTSNESMGEGSFYGSSNMLDFSSENDVLVSAITSSMIDMKQRTEALLKTISTTE